MYRRNPTRIELKLDDMTEYDRKKEKMCRDEKSKDTPNWSPRNEKTPVRTKEERIGVVKHNVC